MGMGIDNTDRKKKEERNRLERQFQQAQKMEAIRIIAGGIAHDFNNILAGVIGYAEIAMESLPSGSSSKRGLG